MKHRISFLILGLASLVILPSLAQNYSIDWFTIDGGGGTSSGGQFTLSGTVGQPDAGTLTGGNFELEGGFWSAITVQQVPDAPILKIKLINGGMAALSWSLSVAGFSLQETTTIAQP